MRQGIMLDQGINYNKNRQTSRFKILYIPNPPQKLPSYSKIPPNIRNINQANIPNLKTMRNQINNYLIMQDFDNDNTKSHYQHNPHFTSFITKSNSKKTRSQSRKNQNQQLQELLQTETVNYSNLSHLSAQKKRLFPDLSFLSKDCTQDHSNYEGYAEMMNKIHFQRSRTHQLNQELTKIKQQLIKKYLAELMDELNELSDENKRLRQVYKKQAGGGYRQKAQQRNNSNKHQQSNKLTTQPNFHPETPNPRNSLKTGRKSVNGGSVAGSQQPFGSNKYNTVRQNGMKQKSFFGVGNQKFCQTPRIQTIMAKPNKMQYCQSSIDIQAGQSLVPSPKKHKRRQSQLTERKDYPGKENLGNDFLMSLDDESQMSIENQITGRMSQPGKMPKQRYAKQVDEKFNMKDSGNWGMSNCGRNNFGDTIERNSIRMQTYENDQSIAFPSSTKNIFLQFLQALLVQERATYAQMTDQINEATIQAEQNFVVPSYNANMKHIEKLQKEIMTKNFKLRQLQEVINVFKAQIQQIMGTDIRLIDQLMQQLLQVKGKFLEMQKKVNGITGLRNQVEAKEKLKEDILTEIKQKMEKRKIESQNKKNQPSKQASEYVEPFPIPQSLKTLFDFLNINMPKNSKPIDYLKEVKELPSNKELFQAFDQKKRASCNMKIKEVIDQIREGRKKFNEVIKIYQGRIVKLQQKIQKYKQKEQQNSEKKGRIDQG